jgi:ribosome biogenesis GTPase
LFAAIRFDIKINIFVNPFISKMPTLESLGFTPALEQYRLENLAAGFETGRIVAEHKERYVVATAAGEFDAEITGHLRFAAQSRADFPAVGDWVAVVTYEPDTAIIHRILPRRSVIQRKAVGHDAEIQIIATNIDTAFIVQAADRDFNVNRMERYLAICMAAGVDTIVVITKSDLVDHETLEEMTGRVHSRLTGVPVVAVSNLTHEGIAALQERMEPGNTYCLLGSSGVGKSTLLNLLSGSDFMKTDSISTSTGKGRHVTSHRELVVLQNGAILIDNPGMREVGIADPGEGLSRAFDQISLLAGNCRFPDCTHTSETGCAVLQAVETGELDPAAYENYLRMAREKAHFESSSLERRQKDKMFGKMMKNYHKGRSGGL